MKKLIMTIAIVFGMCISSFAQEDAVIEEKGLFGKGAGFFRNSSDEELLGFPGYELETDQDAENTPLGSGIAVLAGLGAAYLLGKKRKEE